MVALDAVYEKVIRATIADVRATDPSESCRSFPSACELGSELSTDG